MNVLNCLNYILFGGHRIIIKDSDKKFILTSIQDLDIIKSILNKDVDIVYKGNPNSTILIKNIHSEEVLKQ